MSSVSSSAASLDLPITDSLLDNQWPVNFNWALSSFEPHIRGVYHLVHFSFASAHKSFLLFISSVSAVGAWKVHGKVPEEPIYDLNVASNMGYGQSKLISECLLDKAAEISGVPSACCRVGIVAGPVEKRLGIWNKHEYIPSVSSPYFGCDFRFFCIYGLLHETVLTYPIEDHHLIRLPRHLPCHLSISRSDRLAACGQAIEDSHRDPCFLVHSSPRKWPTRYPDVSRRESKHNIMVCPRAWDSSLLP